MSPRTAGIAARVAGILTGVGLMAAPAVIEMGELATAIARIAGPIQAAFCFVALAGVVSAVRFASIAVGVALLVCAAIVFEVAGSAVLGVAGLAMVALGLVPLPSRSRFDGGWRQAWRDLRRPPASDGAASADR